MNLVLLRQGDWIDADRVLLRDQRAGHIRAVLKARVGDTLRVGLLGGLVGQGVIEAMAPEGARLRVALTDPPPPRHRFDIVLALPRPKMLRRILRQCAEFGIANLHLLHSARVEKSFWQSPLLQPAALEEAPLALAQAPPVPAVVMVGPEGGFVPLEIQLAEAVIARRVSLGARTLSVDTALVTVLAQAPQQDGRAS
jgi:16S rRNA U1498 N3-methylase RsmE